MYIYIYIYICNGVGREWSGCRKLEKGGPLDLAGYMVLVVIYCSTGVSEGDSEGACEGNSAACVSA